MLNRVMLIGRLGRDPEIRRLETGAAVARFSLATDESYKDKDGNLITQTEWHTIIAWRAQAEFAEKYLKKGMLIFVEGKLSHREYEKDGQKRYTTEVIANTFKMLERRDSSAGSFPTAADEPPVPAYSPMADPVHSAITAGSPPPDTDDLPF